MCEMVCRFWFVCHISSAGISHEISACREKCLAVDQSGCEHSRLQETHFPDRCQCFDAKTVTATLVSTPTISEFSWIQRGVDCRCQQSHVAVETSSRVFGISTIASAPNLDSVREEFSGRAVITSTTTASASARGSPECDDCQKTADFFSCLSISKSCLKSSDRLPCATEGAGIPCVRNRETFSGSRPASQSYEVNRAAQRSSAPTVADVRALNAISLKAQRSSETTLRYPRGVINVSSAQLVTYGDASFANMEGSKSQCVVIVFLTHEPWRSWRGELLPSCLSGRRQESLDGCLRIPPWLVSHAWCS